MQSLVHIEIFQNGIKEDAMAELLGSLQFNLNLEVLKLNDNVIKNACQVFLEVLPNLSQLKILDISDSLLGNEFSIQIFKIISTLPEIKEVYCNYNEIDKKSIQKGIMELCLIANSLEVVELKGNDIDPSIWKKFRKDLSSKIKKFEPYSDEEEVAFDEEEEIEEDLTKEIEKLEIKDEKK